MHYAKLKYSPQEVNRAARALIADTPSDDLQHEIDVVDNWRAAHQFPLSSMYMTLKGRAIAVNPKSLTAQRIKRLASIKSKLIDRPDMKLTQMQDIGGCRAIVPTLDDVFALRDLYESRPISHEKLLPKDYIAEPKPTGYRGIHLRYRYAGRGQSAPWKGMKIELQLRSQLQHTWATAVEAAATFTNAPLKSNLGDADWLRFFALMSSVFALREGTPPVPGTPRTDSKLVYEIRRLNNRAHIAATFARYAALIPHIQNRNDAFYYLIELDPLASRVAVRGFKKTDIEAATNAYVSAERSLPAGTTKQVVLVSVSSIRMLQKAYPNYFLDTQNFVEEIRNIVGVMALH